MTLSIRALPALLLTLALSSCTCHQEPPPGASGALRPERSGIVARPPRSMAPPAPQAKEEEEAQPEPPRSAEIPELPDNFPGDVPVFEGAELAAVQDLAGDAHNVLFTVDAPAAEVFSFYKEDLRGKGHNMTQQYETGEQSFLSFRKGQLVTNIVMAPDPNDPSRLVIAVMYQYEDEIEEF